MFSVFYHSLNISFLYFLQIIFIIYVCSPSFSCMHKGLATKESKNKPCLRTFNLNFILAYQRDLLFSSLFLLLCGEKFSINGIGQGDQKPCNKVSYFIRLLCS